jgi:GDP-L-fucose synthase
VIEIRELAQLISKIVGWSGSILWNKAMPNGAAIKTLDSTVVRALGWRPSISLEDGLREVYQQIQGGHVELRNWLR